MVPEPDQAWWEALVQVSLDGQFILRPIPAASSTVSPATEYEVVYSNEAGAAFLSLGPELLIGRRLSEVLPPYGTGFREALETALQSGTAVHRVFKRVGPVLEQRRFEVRVQPFGGLLALSIIDRSAEHDAEQQLAVLREALVAGANSNDTAVALLLPVHDGAGRVVDIIVEELNEAGARMLQVNRNDLIGQRLSATNKTSWLELRGIVGDCLKKRRAITRDIDGADFDLSVRWVNVQVSPIDPFVILYAVDLTQQGQHSMMLRAIVDNAAELILYSDRDGRIQYANPYALQSLGFDAQNLIGASILDFTVPEERSFVVGDFFTLQAQEGVINRRTRVVDAGGKVRTLAASTTLLRTSSGEPDAYVTVASDLTERIANEEARENLGAELAIAEQRERERLAEELHDGPVQDLTALSMQLGSLLADTGDVSLTGAEDLVVKVIEDLRSLMFQLSAPELDGDRLGQHIRQRAELLFAGSGVQLSFTGSLRIPPSQRLAVTLFRLAQEALVNVRKHANASEVSVSLHDNGGSDTIELEITDNGNGAEPQRYARHQPGHFGIAMMIDRASQLGGSCVVSGAPKQGTVVTVSLPRLTFGTEPEN
jgi:PAS domain S-box-containing protein